MGSCTGRVAGGREGAGNAAFRSNWICAPGSGAADTKSLIVTGKSVRTPDVAACASWMAADGAEAGWDRLVGEVGTVGTVGTVATAARAISDGSGDVDFALFPPLPGADGTPMELTGSSAIAKSGRKSG